MISTLQSCWYQLYGRAAEGVDQKVRVGDWSLKGTGNLVHIHLKNSHCDDVALFILGSFCYILGTSCPWWVSVENWGAGAEPEVCVCGSCVQHPREHVGQQRRSHNTANSSIYANTTGLNMGAHGTGTLCSHEEHKMLQVESFFCFNKPFSVLSVVNIMMMLMTEALFPFFSPQVAFQTEQFALAKRACRTLWSHFTFHDNGSQRNQDRLATATGWGRKCIINQELC